MKVLFALLLFALGCVTVAGQEAVPKRAAERAIYIPYDRLWEVFEKKGRGVFLPYEDYERLREAARQREAEPTKEPVASLVAETSGTVTVTGAVASVEASFRIEVLAKGWQRVPLGLRDVAVTRATVGKEPARLVYDAAVGYALLVNNEDGKPQSVALELAFAKACVTAPGRNSVSFQPPPAPVGRWQVRVPEPGVKIEVKPVVAATETATGDGKSTVVNAFVGAAPSLEIAWTPKAEGARGLQALVAVTSGVSVQLGEGIARVKARLVSTVTRAEVAGQTLLVPQAYRIVNVFDENVRSWTVKKQGDMQEVEVQFFKPVLGRQELLVELERLADETEVSVPTVAVHGASREQGELVVGVAEGLRAEVVRRERLAQQDLGELTKEKGGDWRLGYRFASVPYALVLRLAKVEPRLVPSSLTEVQLRPEALTVVFSSVIDVQRAGVFRIDLSVPDGFSVEDVSGLAGKGNAPAAIDGYHAGEAVDGMVPLTVNLAKQAKGWTGLRVRLVRKLDEPALQRPGGEAAVFELATPRLAGAGVQRESGKLVVYAPGSLRVTPVETVGLRPSSPAVSVQTAPGIGPQGLVGTLAYAYEEGNARLRMEARRRPPFVTVEQMLRPTFGSASVRYVLTLRLAVQYSGIERLRVDLPKELTDVRPEQRSVRLVPSREDAPADLAEGYAVWYLEPETEFVGSTRIALVWTERTEALDVGKSLSVEVPRIVVQGVDRTFGQILLHKEEGVDVQPVEAEGLRPIDPRHDVMQGEKANGAVRAFEFHGDWRLTVQATRYEEEAVKATSIERGLVRMVLTRGNVTSVQAIYKLSTMRQRLVLVLPAGVALDTQHLWLNGRNANLERGEADSYLVPLAGIPQGRSFLMELRYTVPGGGELIPPSFPEEPAVQRIYLSVHVPAEMAYLGYGGDWHPEFRWAATSGSSLRPRASRKSENLVHWVCEGLSADEAQLLGFATDGFHVLYSTLRPQAGEAGALRLRLARSWQVRGVLVAVILVVGLVLLRSSLTSKTAGALGVLVGWILLAMILPSFARSMLSGAAMGAVLVVGGVWFLWCLVALRPRLRFVSFGDEQRDAAMVVTEEPAEDGEEQEEDKEETDHA